MGCSDCLGDIFQRLEGKSSIHFIEQSLFPFGHVLLVFFLIMYEEQGPNLSQNDITSIEIF